MSISENDKNLVALAIKKAELNTSGEIVPMILKQSDFYPASHFRLSLIMSMLFSFLCYYCYDFSDPLILVLIQIPGFLFGYALAFIPFVKRIFSTKKELKEEVHQRALEAFYDTGVSMTRDRTGILIFVSLLERKIEVLADCGINEKVSVDYWNDLVAKLSQRIATGNLAEGMVEAIEKCGKSLTEHFPRKVDDTNEIADKLHI